MKKALVIFSIALLLFVSCALLALYFAMQSPYTTKVTNHILKQYSPPPISVHEATFQFPNHLSFKGVEVKELQDENIIIEQVDIWVSTDSITESMPVIDSILINGLLLQDGIPDIPKIEPIKLRQLAITNLDYSDGEFISRDTDIQIENPLYLNENQPIPFGSIQYSAEQVYWHREAFNNVLIDLNYQEENSTVYGASFEWRGGAFSTQAEQYLDGWSLVNTTIDRLRLNTKQWDDIDTSDWSFITEKITHLNSLDILSSTIETPNFQASDIDLSLENISLINRVWQQKDGYISFSAESINYLNHLWLEPAFESYFDHDLISIEALNFEFEKGFVTTVGELTPNSAYLKNLDIDGVKWIYESPEDYTLISQYINSLDSLIIDDVKIRRSQFIQIATQPHWQFSGLSLDGKDLTLKKKNKTGLWNGQIRVTANNASFKNLVTSQPLITMQSEDGIWKLHEAFIPLEKGLIEATASYTLSQPSQPWRVEAFADGLPIELFSQWLDLPVEAEAIAEFQMSLNGLGGDALMLKHSLTGELVGSLRDSVLLQENDSDIPKTTPFESSEFSVSADRGRIIIAPIQIKGEGLSGSLQGNIDLVQTEDNTILLQLIDGCINQSFDLVKGSLQQENNCPKK
ncbi:AsmA family protein [Vibrio algarum]|uniref:AsmA family protein n=1 Tax=Vibrio algarum TaxID=3020714 RepID=A0ABT4YM73_9VIBR|nr:AsmA family protein [Vibrio sp. KJ40-1]MDB1122507.1 AsmA family protein [Vibrio sp. KJ40-1]